MDLRVENEFVKNENNLVPRCDSFQYLGALEQLKTKMEGLSYTLQIGSTWGGQSGNKLVECFVIFSFTLIEELSL